MPKDRELRVVALFDYSGTTDEELDIYQNDLFTVINKDNSDWWYVRDENDDRRVGYVPRTYIAIADDEGNPVHQDEDEGERTPKSKLTARIKENFARATLEASSVHL
ncbi:SH3 domain-containing protein [Obelidium mucronatum]|nr:SH3 domain-containing protein [Obelidium mucronatum]